jgi:hypothetical protein
VETKRKPLLKKSSQYCRGYRIVWAWLKSQAVLFIRIQKTAVTTLLTQFYSGDIILKDYFKVEYLNDI